MRAMGFDSETSKQLLTGLAKQKILSGVGSEAIDRTTLNLAQLASGGGDLQDIKDLVQNLPTARKEINEAFGSLQGFQAALKANPQAAIKRFAEELAGVTAPAGGFDDAMQKLNDSFIEMGRSAGQPLLDPITRSMQELTAIVHSNKDAWSSWGDFVANKINGVNAIVSAGRGLNEQTDGWLGWAAGKWAGQVIDQNIPTWAKALGLSVDTAGKAGQMYERLGALSPAKAGGVIDLGDKKQKSAMELQMEVLAEQARNKEAQEAAFRQARGQFLDQSESLVNTKLNNAYRVREAMLKNHLSASQASEIQSIQQTTALRNAQLAAQLQNEKVFLQERMKIAKPEEMAGLQMKLAEAESNAQAEMMANSLNAQAQIREAMKRTKEEIASIFIAGQQENPFVQIFDQGRLAAERITEATRGLSPALRESLMLMNQNAVATQAFGQALDNRLQASNLRDEARQFLQGKLDADSPANFQSNLDRQLNSIGAFGRGAFDGEDGGQIAKRVIALTQGVDPSKLTASQRRVAADARLVEAARLEKQEEDALNTQKQLVKVLTDLENAVKGGAIVKVVNEAPEKAKVQTKPRAADAASYYNTASTAMTRVNI